MPEPLRLYNTRTRQEEEFHPLRAKRVGLYSCGPTVYSTPTLGNLRAYVFVDILKRTLQANGYRVQHVMNITDVGHLTSDADTGDDKLQSAAAKAKTSAWNIAARYTTIFHQDLERLDILPANAEIKATDTIPEQIALIQTLEKKGFTYVLEDGVYFDTSKFPAYGQLSGQRSSEKKAGARVSMVTGKKHPTDFALWKLTSAGTKRDMEWDSPWGKGFPGWHLECSAISMKELGPQFDIHTGGIDHIAVHHENEIAQSEAATGKHPFVNIWLHNAFLVLPGKRMGKSEGNAITMKDVLDRGIHPLAFRYLCLQTHYRQSLEFSWTALEAANTGLRRLWNIIATLSAEPQAKKIKKVNVKPFLSAINDDLNTAKALPVLNEMLGSTSSAAEKLLSAQKIDEILGLGLNPDFAQKQSIGTIPPGVSQLVAERERARQAKEWAKADEIRAAIEKQGFSVEDTPTGQQLRKK